MPAGLSGAVVAHTSSTCQYVVDWITAQVLLAGVNIGLLSPDDVYIFSMSYAACLDYPSVEVSPPCAQVCTPNAVPVGRGERASF